MLETSNKSKEKTLAAKRLTIYSAKAIKQINKEQPIADSNKEIFIEGAQECLYEIRKQSVVINRQLLNTSESNGIFYNLSEQKRIGWQYCWKEIYK